jgi:hypothetical protein
VTGLDGIFPLGVAALVRLIGTGDLTEGSAAAFLEAYMTVDCVGRGVEMEGGRPTRFAVRVGLDPTNHDAAEARLAETLGLMNLRGAGDAKDVGRGGGEI